MFGSRQILVNLISVKTISVFKNVFITLKRVPVHTQSHTYCDHVRTGIATLLLIFMLFM